MGTVQIRGPGDPPTLSEIRTAWDALADVDEFVFSPIRRSVLALTNAEGEDRVEEVTPELIVALLGFIQDSRMVIEGMVKSLEIIEGSLLSDLLPIAQSGDRNSGPLYDLTGKRQYG